MSKTAMRITLLGVIFCFLFSGCNTQDKIGSMLTATPEPTTTATPTPTFAPTSTSTPTATPTPISIESAVKQGSLTEIETIGKGYIRKSIYSPDGSYLVIVVTRGLYIFNSDTMEEKKFFPLTPGTSIESVVFSNDGKIFAAGDSNSDVTIWNTQTWEITQILQLNNGPIISIDFSPDGYYMATVGGTYETSYKLSLWNLTDGLLINAYYRGKSCKRVDFSSDGTRIFLSEGRDITVWYVKDLQLYDRKIGRAHV